MTDLYAPPPELVLGTRLNTRVPDADQHRQREEVVEILRRLRNQPGVILADEVGMGKTFVALGIAYSIAVRSPRGPAIVMVPANLIDKWEQDLKTFCSLYLDDRKPVRRDVAERSHWLAASSVRYGIARHSIDLMKLLDDTPRERCHLIFLAQGAMSRRQSDKWIRLALIAESLRRHGRGGAIRLIQVKNQIHRFLGELLWAIGEERAHKWGEELWQDLLRTAPESWRETYNNAIGNERRRLVDDPVPKAVIRVLRSDKINLKELARSLEEMPVRARGGDARISERLDTTRKALRKVEEELWKGLLAQTRWRSPLLVMDEAHHLKNPGTSLARQLQSPDLETDLRTGDGAMAQAFERMLFLTATPFQLGHHELVRVLERFGDVRWDAGTLGNPDDFRGKLSDLGQCLNNAQRGAIRLQQSWTRLRSEDCSADVESWWTNLLDSPHDVLNTRQRAVVDAYQEAKCSRDAAQKAVRPWIVRHNKRLEWEGTRILRRERRDGAAILDGRSMGGLPIPPQQLLPFFLAARSAVNPADDLLGEALCSSFEAFRFTRQSGDKGKDEQDESAETEVDLSHSRWYLGEFDRAMERCRGSTHPKVDATVRKVVDLWEAGEKVLVFAFYRQTCRALRIHISQEVERRSTIVGIRQLREAGHECSTQDLERLLARTQDYYFDKGDSPGRLAIDAALRQFLLAHEKALEDARVPTRQREELLDVMRRFLRVSTTLVRAFPLAELDSIDPCDAAKRVLDHSAATDVSWRTKFDDFVRFLCEQCATNDERQLYLSAVLASQTGKIRVEQDEDEDRRSSGVAHTLANVRVASGKTKRETRAQLMRAFNTPFFPDILVCSQVMGEGVDLQRFCCHVIHHDLDWNPSTIEQRTGRIDRLGCMAEGRRPIRVYLPYLAGTADERQYQVMSDRERWFRVVMGQDEVARLISPGSTSAVHLPDAVSTTLGFELGLDSHS